MDTTRLIKNTAYSIPCSYFSYLRWQLIREIEAVQLSNYNQLDEDISGSQRTEAQSESGIEIETDPSNSEVTGITTGPGPGPVHYTSGADFNEKIKKFLSERSEDIDLRYFCQKNKTPMGNTMLHMAAWYGDDDVVDVVAEHAPDLLFSFNKNEDTTLHVAARAGNVHTLEKLLATYANFQSGGIAEAWKEYKKRSGEEEESMGYPSAEIKKRDLKELGRKKNIAQGNTMLHEAMISGKLVNILQAFEANTIIKDRVGFSLSECCYEYALVDANHAKKSVLYLAVEAGDYEVVKLILEMEKAPPSGNPALPTGPLSPMVAAIMKQNADMLKILLDKKPDWIHLMDKLERLPLHYAASTGYLEGVLGLLDRCKCCSNRKDKYGYFPLHLASHEGHVNVVKVLLTYCPNPTETLDSYNRNILHIATRSGKLEVVRYILQTATENHYEMMINQRDSRGDTPLHLAPHSYDPKTVFYLTWDDRVHLCEVNEKKETALDVANALYQPDVENPSMRQQLVWIALKSAGVPSSSKVLPIESKRSYSKPDEKSPEMKLTSIDKVGNNDISDRVETLSVVLTLIITASVAACLAVPGETDDKGGARNLNHVMFQIFIMCITISLFSSICAIIILFWARLGIIELVTYSLKIVMPLQGLALISLSLAFLAGIYTVINKLSWLATLFLVMAGIFVVVELSLYILLFLPSSSTNKLLRYMSYHPFLFLASLAESNQGTTSTSFQLLGFEVRAFKK